MIYYNIYFYIILRENYYLDRIKITKYIISDSENYILTQKVIKYKNILKDFFLFFFKEISSKIFPKEHARMNIYFK